MTSKKRNLIIALIILGVIGAVYFAYFYNRTIATVGDYEITVKDEKYRDKVHKVFYPNDPNNYGKEQLIKAFTHAQILKNNGFKITDQILKEEEARINRNTKAPETLQKIKDIFKGDMKSYRKVFILPTLVERTIYFDFFNKNQNIQERSLSRVRDFIKRTKESKRSLQELARERNLNFKKFVLSKKRGIEWLKSDQETKREKQAGLIDKSGNAPPPKIQEHVEKELEGRSLNSAKFWIENVIPQLRPGNLIQEPVDHGETWMVVKYAKNLGGNGFLMEAVFFPKDSYEDWLKSETDKITIEE